MMERPAVFLDRDGVIVENQDDYITSYEKVRFLAGGFKALRRLVASGYTIVLVTNQSVVGRGIISMADAIAIHERVLEQIAAHGIQVAATYICPHRPDEGCMCRKPAPGMLLQAAIDLNLDLARSYLIGDAVSDVQAGLAARVHPILVRTGRGAEQEARLIQYGFSVCPVVNDLATAVDYILEQA